MICPCNFDLFPVPFLLFTLPPPLQYRISRPMLGLNVSYPLIPPHILVKFLFDTKISYFLFSLSCSVSKSVIFLLSYDNKQQRKRFPSKKGFQHTACGGGNNYLVVWYWPFDIKMMRWLIVVIFLLSFPHLWCLILIFILGLLFFDSKELCWSTVYATTSLSYYVRWHLSLSS